MSIYKGNVELPELHIGTTEIGQVYHGSTPIWAKSEGSFKWIQSEPIVCETNYGKFSDEFTIRCDNLIDYGFKPITTSEERYPLYIDYVSPAATINIDDQLTYIPGLITRHFEIYPIWISDGVGFEMRFEYKFDFKSPEFTCNTIEIDVHSTGAPIEYSMRCDLDLISLEYNELFHNGTMVTSDLTVYSTNPGSPWDGTMSGYGAPLPAATNTIVVGNSYYHLYA